MLEKHLPVPRHRQPREVERLVELALGAGPALNALPLSLDTPLLHLVPVVICLVQPLHVVGVVALPLAGQFGSQVALGALCVMHHLHVPLLLLKRPQQSLRRFLPLCLELQAALLRQLHLLLGLELLMVEHLLQREVERLVELALLSKSVPHFSQHAELVPHHQ